MAFEDERKERDFRMNPPSDAPGQNSGNDDGWGNLFEDSDTNAGSDNGGNNDFSGGSSFNSGSIGTDPMGGGFGGPSMVGGQFGQSEQPAQKGEWVDRAAEAGFKGFVAFMKDFTKSFMNNTKGDWHNLGNTIFKVSGILLAIGFILTFLGIFIKSIHGTINLLLGSCLGVLTSIPLMMFMPKENKTPEPPDPEPASEPESDQIEDIFSDDSDSSDFDEFEDSDSSEFEEEQDFGLDDVDSVDLSDFNPEEAVNNLTELPSAGMYTRQYLYDAFIQVLPTMNPQFAHMDEIYDSSDEFMMFENMIREAAYQVGTKEENIPELQSMRKNMFIIQLECTRPVGIKEKDIADMVADSYSRWDDVRGESSTYVQESKQGMFATTDSRVGAYVINIFLTKTPMVSLGDIYKNQRDWILGTNGKPPVMPLVWGVNEFGNVYKYDGIKDDPNGSMLIAGMGRSGKSWKGQSLIAQMTMFTSPKDLNFYFFDVKKKASDFYYLSTKLPHVKGFCGDALQFTTRLHSIINDIEKRYNKAFNEDPDNIYQNIKDYNEDHPENHLPYTYIVIDEMAAAMKDIEGVKDGDIPGYKDGKEMRKDFDNILVSITTKYPYLGIRVILFPHRIVQEIISKTTATMIPLRAVMGNVPFEELKNSLDIKSDSDFPYHLVKTGDMAIKTKNLSQGKASYSHAEVLTDSNNLNKKVFNYIGLVWNKIEPGCGGLKFDIDGVVKSSNKQKISRESKPARDNSIESEYKYGGYSSMDDIMQDDGMQEEDNSTDESFWDNLLSDDSTESRQIDKESNKDSTGSSSFWDTINEKS